MQHNIIYIPLYAAKRFVCVSKTVCIRSRLPRCLKYANNAHTACCSFLVPPPLVRNLPQKRFWLQHLHEQVGKMAGRAGRERRQRGSAGKVTFSFGQRRCALRGYCTTARWHGTQRKWAMTPLVSWRSFAVRRVLYGYTVVRGVYVPVCDITPQQQYCRYLVYKIQQLPVADTWSARAKPFAILPQVLLLLLLQTLRNMYVYCCTCTVQVYAGHVLALDTAVNRKSSKYTYTDGHRAAAAALVVCCTACTWYSSVVQPGYLRNKKTSNKKRRLIFIGK